MFTSSVFINSHADSHQNCILAPRIIGFIHLLSRSVVSSFRSVPAFISLGHSPVFSESDDNDRFVGDRQLVGKNK